MHEMGIATQLIDIVNSSIPKEHKGASVEVVNLEIGKMSAVVPDSLLFCLEILTEEDPILKGAKYNIKEIPVEAQCEDCGEKFFLDQPFFTCKKCKKTNVKIIKGRELNIISIEIDDGED